MKPQTPEEMFEAASRRPMQRAATSRRRVGLGDLVYAVTRWFGIRHCAKCHRRKGFLNRITPAWVSRLIPSKVK